MTGGGATGVAEALQGNYRAGQDEHVSTPYTVVCTLGHESAGHLAANRKRQEPLIPHNPSSEK